MGPEYALTILTAICLALSGWALKRVSSHDAEIAQMRADGAGALEHAKTLSEVRDMVLGTKQTTEGMLERFQAFEQRYDHRSDETAKLAADLDKRVALIELHLKYQSKAMTHENQ
jgi:hypothetical protein